MCFLAGLVPPIVLFITAVEITIFKNRQTVEQAQKVAELNTLFLSLSDKGQESALNILRSLDFAQSVMLTSQEDGSPDRKDSI